MILCPSTPPRGCSAENQITYRKNNLTESLDTSEKKKTEKFPFPFGSFDTSQAGVISSFHIQSSNRGERRNNIRRLVRLFKDLVKRGNFKGEFDIKEIYPRFKKTRNPELLNILARVFPCQMRYTNDRICVFSELREQEIEIKLKTIYVFYVFSSVPLFLFSAVPVILQNSPGIPPYKAILY